MEKASLNRTRRTVAPSHAEHPKRHDGTSYSSGNPGAGRASPTPTGSSPPLAPSKRRLRGRCRSSDLPERLRLRYAVGCDIAYGNAPSTVRVHVRMQHVMHLTHLLRDTLRRNRSRSRSGSASRNWSRSVSRSWKHVIIYIYIYTHMYTCMYIYIYIYAYIHTHYNHMKHVRTRE